MALVGEGILTDVGFICGDRWVIRGLLKHWLRVAHT